MYKTICSIILVLACINIYPQITNNNGGWNVYTSMREVNSVSILGNDVWAASTGGLFRFDAAGLGNVKKFTTLDGLLSNELYSGIADLNGNIWAGAADGSISVYYPTGDYWRVISDIRNSGESNRRINHFFQYGNFMFFATEFCIVKFSINQFQFVDQPYIYYIQGHTKAPANWIHVVNDTIWTATDYGIAYANVNTSLPVGSSWKNYTASNSVLNRNTVNTIGYFANKVFFGTDSGMVYFQNGVLQKYEPLFNGNPVRDPVKTISVVGNSMYFSSYRNSNRIYKVVSGNINQAQEVYSGVVNNFKAGSNGNLYIGTDLSGVDVFKNNAHNYVFPNGQLSNLALNINVDLNGNAWAVSGSTGNWSINTGVYKLDASGWFNYTFSNFPVMGQGCCGWVSLYADRNSDIWVSGWGNGLLKIHGSELTRYNENNSILQAVGPDFVLVYGADEDNAGKLWVANNLVEKNIVNFTDQISYPAPAANSFQCFFINLVIDNYNTKWMPLHDVEGLFRGLMYFNENTNPRGGLIPYGNLGANVSKLNDILVDNNGEVWIATNNGITIIPDPSQVVNNPGITNPFNYKMSIVENGLSTPLTENVTSIDVDALNNKWIGTISNGLLYVSPDGTTLLKRFNVTNSPLLDNQVNSIKSDRKTGTVYFGSNKGISSYKTIAITPLTECDKITVGPNPFIVPGNTSLRIDGLVEESTVKIISISGALVAEFETAGGRVTTWDGRDTYGNYVSSGIYIIAGYNKDGSKVCRGKVAIIRN